GRLQDTGQKPLDPGREVLLGHAGIEQLLELRSFRRRDGMTEGERADSIDELLLAGRRGYRRWHAGRPGRERGRRLASKVGGGIGAPLDGEIVELRVDAATEILGGVATDLQYVEDRVVVLARGKQASMKRGRLRFGRRAGPRRASRRGARAAGRGAS